MASPRAMASHRATPGRPLRALASIEPMTEPPNKRIKFMPGGPRGGGRYIDSDGNELSRADAVALGVAQTAPRVRSRRDLGSAARANGQSAQPGDGSTPLVTRSSMQTRPRRTQTERFAPEVAMPRPRFHTATAAAAASLATDGYKPREERSWEDFHPDLDLEITMPVYTADEVDGRCDSRQQKLTLLGLDGKPQAHGEGDLDMQDATLETASQQQLAVASLTTPLKRKPGRPPRRPEAMLSGLGSPTPPRIVPLPVQNPKERLNLPNARFHIYNHFLQYEESQKENKANYVDRTMAGVGYQESDRFGLPPVLVRLSEGQQIEDEEEVGLRLQSDGPTETGQGSSVIGKVEYDMDEQDDVWLEEINELRRAEGVDAIKPAILEITLTQIEKEYHALEKRMPKPQPRHSQLNRPRSSSQAAVNGDANPPGDEPDSKCSICDDGDCENTNAIIFCDGCDVAVHQECYGVPFIPEGHWFCRKCKITGTGTPMCVFCPNIEGAFKQTNTQRWSHLLCAIWIPEVTISNLTFMEPIVDVDKVPKGRWKLNCYICNQKMGACIQCGNKNCYQAFHVTCARKAKLYLKMKSQHQGSIDQSALKAFCDKHVPQEWRRMHHPERAVEEAKLWFKRHYRDRTWVDSGSASLEPPPDGDSIGDRTISDDTIAVTKAPKTKPPKISWKTQTGAPVVPAIVYNTVESSIARFNVRRRKEFVEKACKYWTLKREARRGAALLKRLQLQLESFSSMEITRRNFAGMGAAGGPKLQRRIEFAEILQKDMGHLRNLTAQIRTREELRLKEVEVLVELVNNVYFPIPPLLWPILQRAQKYVVEHPHTPGFISNADANVLLRLDEKTKSFRAGFDALADRLRDRYYTSVTDFSRDMSLVFSQVLGENLDGSAPDQNEHGMDTIFTQLEKTIPGTAKHSTLPHEQKELKRLAKRIAKAVKEPLEEATRKEAELRGREMEEEIRKLDSMGMFTSNMKSVEAEGDEDVEAEAAILGKRRSGSDASAIAGASLSGECRTSNGDVEMLGADERTDEAVIHLNLTGKTETVPIGGSQPTPPSQDASYASSSNSDHAQKTKPAEPLSPPNSTFSAPINTAPSASGDSSSATGGTHDFLAKGGIAWYLAPFDPVGTTVNDERYTGRAVLRDMSEELSDMDEDTLTELATGADNTPAASAGLRASVPSPVVAQKKAAAKKKRGRRQQWSR